MTLKHINYALSQEARHCCRIFSFNFFYIPPWWFTTPWLWSIPMVICFKKLGFVFISWSFTFFYILHGGSLCHDFEVYQRCSASRSWALFSFTTPWFWSILMMLCYKKPGIVFIFLVSPSFTSLHRQFIMPRLQIISMMLCFKKLSIDFRSYASPSFTSLDGDSLCFDSKAYQWCFVSRR